jgi:hypothetical protein
VREEDEQQQDFGDVACRSRLLCRGAGGWLR